MYESKTKGFLTVLLIILLIVGVVALSVALSKTITTRDLNGFQYTIGGLDAEGEFEESTASVCTKDLISVDGLKCKIVKRATIEYKLFFYDKDGEFISATADLDANYESDPPEGARYVKIMITPTNDAEITIFEKSGVVKQLTVTVSK